MPMLIKVVSGLGTSETSSQTRTPRPLRLEVPQGRVDGVPVPARRQQVEEFETTGAGLDAAGWIPAVSVTESAPFRRLRARASSRFPPAAS